MIKYRRPYTRLLKQREKKKKKKEGNKHREKRIKEKNKKELEPSKQPIKSRFFPKGFNRQENAAADT